MENALKEIFGSMFESEMTEHLGYSSNDYGAKNTSNRRNGYSIIECSCLSLEKLLFTNVILI